MRKSLISQAALALLPISAVAPASACDRDRTEAFAVVPNLPGNNQDDGGDQ
jgi:hypothetical protein